MALRRPPGSTGIDAGRERVALIARGHADGSGTPALAARAIRPSFGTNNTPRKGAALVVLSTGNAAAPSQANPAHVAFEPGVAHGLLSPAPSDWLAANASAIPVAPGCPAPTDTLARDPVMLR